MNCEVKELAMSDGNVNFVYHWIPVETESVVVLIHGMAEHAARYARFAEFLAKNKIALIAEDHRGHGKTGLKAQTDGTGMPGFLADKDGFNLVTEDIHEEILYAKKIFPGKKIFLLGHSFGSFIAQNVIEKYGDEIAKAVLCGTAGPRLLTVAFANFIGGIIKFFEGAKKQSRFMNFLTFGLSNSKIKNRRTDFDWLSRDKNEVDLYIKDELCGFDATNGFLCDIYSGLRQIHKKSNILKIPKDLPVFLVAGTADPVGSYGKTVKKLFDCYKKSGMKNVSMRLYEGARHELFNEINREEVMDDILHFLQS